jgi:hypothetical protein
MAIYSVTNRGTVFNTTAATASQEALLIPTQTDSVIRVKVEITSCATDDYDEGDTYEIVGLFKNDGGTLSLIGSVTAVHTAIETTGGRDVTLAVSGTDISVDISPSDTTPLTWVINPTVTVVTKYAANSGWVD